MIGTECVVEPLRGTSAPLGTAWMPQVRLGVDLAAAGYVEEEYLIRGSAAEWTYGVDWRRIESRRHSYVTRVLVRRPIDHAAASGLVQLEPLHPNLDRATSWRAAHEWIMRNGHTWVGVTQDATMAGLAAECFPERYASLSLPAHGLVYDILGDVSLALYSGAFGVRAEYVVLSGWSATGSICRLFAQEGFVDDYCLPDGRSSVSGVIIGISSGAASTAGYPHLSAGAPTLPLDHARRAITGNSIPVFEVLSEFESETHQPVLRPDSDRSNDRYRLYQIAGTSHANLESSLLTNEHQFRQAGIEVPERRITETPSDARMDYIVRAIYELMDRWLRNGLVPPKADRFTPSKNADDVGRVVELERDVYGNVLGGIRTPWVEAPLNAYLPHSTPAAGYCSAPPWTPLANPDIVARLIGHMCPLPHDAVAEWCSNREDYLHRFSRSIAALQADGFLLPSEAKTLEESAMERWNSWSQSVDTR